MSIEYIGTPRPPLSTNAAECIIAKFDKFPEIVVLRKTTSEVGIALRTNENAEHETATINISPNRVYVGFHACHRNQRELVLGYLTMVIKVKGSECELQEE